MISLTAGNCSSSLSNTIISNILHRNCILLCKVTVCTSLTVFLWMWLKRILVIWIQNLTGCIKQGISAPALTEIVIIVLLEDIILYGKLYFYFYRYKGKIICSFSYTVNSNVWPHKISPPTSIVMKVTAHVWSTEEKHKLLKYAINRMIRLTWNIQMFRRIPIRSAMKYC